MTIAEAVRTALARAMAEDDNVILLGQLLRYGTAGVTAHLHEGFPERVITMPVSEQLMNGAAMGLALAGMRPVVVHERMDFLAVGMDALVNHIPIWPRKCGTALPVVVLTFVGKGNGQGPQHSKNFTHWFRGMEGWSVAEPQSPDDAARSMTAALRGNMPTLYVLHREHLQSERGVWIEQQTHIRFCGASPRHEAAFYGDNGASKGDPVDMHDPRWPKCNACRTYLYHTAGGFERDGEFTCNMCAGNRQNIRICK